MSCEKHNEIFISFKHKVISLFCFVIPMPFSTVLSRRQRFFVS